MAGFTVHTGTQVVYAADHVDTDRIIPARFLSRVSRVGFGELLFSDVRGGDFPLDQPNAAGTSVLTVGTNFGCGSSREHAVWAIQQAGFKAVIARIDVETPGYSDIFRQNAANCGLLLVELEAEAHTALVEAGTGTEVTINLPDQEVMCGGRTFHFEVNPAVKAQLIAGHDLIGTTLVHQEQIAAYEASGRLWSPPAGANA
jgi:3-isopropylmalate/(R)-2-methylmalate dehydratase small subunit